MKRAFEIGIGHPYQIFIAKSFGATCLTTGDYKSLCLSLGSTAHVAERKAMVVVGVMPDEILCMQDRAPRGKFGKPLCG